MKNTVVIFGVAFTYYSRRGRVHAKVWNTRRMAWVKYGDFATIDDLRDHVIANVASINF